MVLSHTMDKAGAATSTYRGWVKDHAYSCTDKMLLQPLRCGFSSCVSCVDRFYRFYFKRRSIARANKISNSSSVLLLPCTHEALSTLVKAAGRGGRHPYVAWCVERLQQWLNRKEGQQVQAPAAAATLPVAPLLAAVAELPESEQEEEPEEGDRGIIEVRSDLFL